ncbi:MAG: protein kinase [bacterium]|nr:protein kinase [bacterium]
MTDTLNQGSILAGKYRIDRVIGSGGFGTIYEAFDLNLQVKVAIKEYFVNVRSGRRDERQEANMIARLEHVPGVIKLMSFFFENGTSYMVMEYVEGETLRDYLQRNGVMDVDFLFSLFQPLLQSIGMMHQEKIIHRDISPDNIMISPNGKLTLIDFGSAIELTSVNNKQEVVLKHGYAAPEQYQTGGYQGTWTDVYAMSATFYRALTGNKPPEALELVRRTALIAWNDRQIPRTVASVLAKGLAVKYTDRISTMEVLSEQLSKAIKEKQVHVDEAFSEGEGGYRGKQGSKNAPIMIAGIVAIMAIIGFVVYGQSRGNKISAHETGVNQGTEISNTMDTEVTVTQPVQTPLPETSQAVADTEAHQTVPEVTMLDQPLEYSSEELFTVREVCECVAITGSDPSLTVAVIPPTIGGLPVLDIEGMGANVTKVVIPEGVRGLGEYSFKNCRYLEEIIIPASLIEISDGAFDNCSSLKTIYISLDNQEFYVIDGEIYSYTYGTKLN